MRKKRKRRTKKEMERDKLYADKMAEILVRKEVKKELKKGNQVGIIRTRRGYYVIPESQLGFE